MHVRPLGGAAAMISVNSVGLPATKKLCDRGQLVIHGHRNGWGQLNRHPLLGIGFSTYTGTVTAADQWDEEPRTKGVLPGLDGSYEALFHEVGMPAFWLDLAAAGPAACFLREPRLQRAIGVIYRPQTERFSHYFEAVLPAQFDAMIHIDHTHALRPMDGEVSPVLDFPTRDTTARV